MCLFGEEAGARVRSGVGQVQLNLYGVPLAVGFGMFGNIANQILIPDGARNLVSFGVGRTFGNMDIDIAYQLAIGVTRTIVNDSVADGSYSFLSNAVSISVGYHF